MIHFPGLLRHLGCHPGKKDMFMSVEASELRLLSWIGHVNTTEWSHCVTLFSHHSHLYHCSCLYHYVIVILYGHRVKAPQCSGADYGFLNYHTIFIPEYSVPKWPEICYDKIMLVKVVTIDVSDSLMPGEKRSELLSWETNPGPLN